MRVFILIISALNAIALPASADEWWSALGWSCDAEHQNLAMYPVRYDARAEMPLNKDGLFVPQKYYGLERESEILILECQFDAERNITVSLIEINTPRPRGECGGAAWSAYVVRDNGQKVAEFSQGCSPTFVQVDRFSLQICSITPPVECKYRVGDAPLRHNYLGDLRGG